jgi:hypothetical protein
MPSKKKSTTCDRTALYEALIASIPSIERKGDANPYTSLNGNMFTLLHQQKLAIRLPETEREKFLKKYQTKLFEAYGTVMKEYVAVPKHEGAEEVSGLELRVRQDAQTKTDHQEEALTARSADSHSSPCHPEDRALCEPKDLCTSLLL